MQGKVPYQKPNTAANAHPENEVKEKKKKDLRDGLFRKGELLGAFTTAGRNTEVYHREINRGVWPRRTDRYMEMKRRECGSDPPRREIQERTEIKLANDLGARDDSTLQF